MKYIWEDENGDIVIKAGILKKLTKIRKYSVILILVLVLIGLLLG